MEPCVTSHAHHKCREILGTMQSPRLGGKSDFGAGLQRQSTMPSRFWCLWQVLPEPQGRSCSRLSKRQQQPVFLNFCPVAVGALAPLALHITLRAGQLRGRGADHAGTLARSVGTGQGPEAALHSGQSLTSTGAAGGAQHRLSVAHCPAQHGSDKGTTTAGDSPEYIPTCRSASETVTLQTPFSSGRVVCKPGQCAE